MLTLLEHLLRALQHLMVPAMAFWLVAGVVVTERNRRQVIDDEADLLAVKEVVRGATGLDYAGKIERRQRLLTWATEHPKSPVAHWINTTHNIAVAGSIPESGALTDGIWSFERERFHWFRFFSRYAILVGLLFTSIGLCTTLADIRPALEASGLTEAEWLKQVKGAMAQALTGMSTAFYSSLLGIMATGVLQLWHLLRFAAMHNAYVLSLDAFVQGGLIPVFSAQVERDRNSVILTAVAASKEMFERSYEQLVAVCHRLDSIQGHAERTVQHVGELKTELAVSTNAVADNLKAFGEDIRAFHAVADKLQGYAASVDHTMQAGMQALHTTQETLVASTGQYVEHLGGVIDGLAQATRAVDGSGAAALEANKELQALATNVGAAASALAGQAGHLEALAGSQRDLQSSWREMTVAMSFNEEGVRREIESRRQALEEMVQAFAKESGEQATERMVGMYNQYLRFVSDMTDKRLGELHASHHAFEAAMERRWGQLLTALGAVEVGRP
jgi:chromosome segregation ATPase